MNSKSLRRLAADHGSLHTAGLPPNYLFPPGADSAELTSLDILLAGPVGTPYANGCWRLHLDIPPTYPTAPPTAQFRTRLWHPNIDEATGAVCVETLKRDWTSTLKLRDVLVTISCLLIQPNPASALNEAAGKLANEDWDGYCRRAKLMTEIHAAVPGNIATEVREAQMRGEDVPLEAGPVTTEKKAPSQGKGKERVKTTPRTSKVHQIAAEDEENLHREDTMQEPCSDPEEDWIPGPDANSKPPTSRSNIFGIKGLDNSMQLDSPTKRIFPSDQPPPSESDDKENHDTSDSFITVPSKRTHPHTNTQSLDLHLPQTQLLAPPQDTPELLKFSHSNPFSAIQPNNQTHPLIKEFSYSWEDATILHGTSFAKGEASAGSAENKSSVRKRLANEDFGKKKEWEMKRFKRAGWDLARYNRGDFGARTGIGRL